MIRKLATLCLIGLSLFFLPRIAYAFAFEGEIDFREKRAEIRLFVNAKPCILDFRQTQPRHIEIQADIQDLQTPFFDLTTLIAGTLELNRAENGRRVLRGQVASRYTLLDHQPASELAGDFEVQGRTLKVNSLTLGNFHCLGQVQLRSPYPLSLDLFFKETAIGRILPEEAMRKLGIASGSIDGNISISGVPAKMLMKGRLISYPEDTTAAEYERAVFNFFGVYPVIHLTDSNVIQPDGITFNLTGKLDLSHRETMEQQIAALQKQPLVQDRADRMEWTLKHIETPGRAGATELKYLLRKNEPGVEPSPDGGGMLGVEHRCIFNYEN